MGSQITVDENEDSEYSDSAYDLLDEIEDNFSENKPLDLELELISKKKSILLDEHSYFESLVRNSVKSSENIERLIQYAELRIKILSLEAEYSSLYQSTFEYEAISLKYHILLRDLKAVIQVRNMQTFNTIFLFFFIIQYSVPILIFFRLEKPN